MNEHHVNEHVIYVLSLLLVTLEIFMSYVTITVLAACCAVKLTKKHVE